MYSRACELSRLTIGKFDRSGISARSHNDQYSHARFQRISRPQSQFVDQHIVAEEILGNSEEATGRLEELSASISNRG